MTGSSTRGIKTVLHPVSDPATAKEVYVALLGVPPQTEESYYLRRLRGRRPAQAGAVTEPDDNVLRLLHDG